MPVNDGLSFASDQHTYSVEAVERLIGRHEDPGRSGERDITVMDLISFTRDPGGDYTWTKLHQFDADGWMARRGPLAPDSKLATVLWDFKRAMKKLSLFHQMALGLEILGFTDTEIAAGLDPQAVIDIAGEMDRATRQKLDARRRRIARALNGRPKRNARGDVVREVCPRCSATDPELTSCPHGAIVYTNDMARRLALGMNNGRGKPRQTRPVRARGVGGSVEGSLNMGPS